ncbi:MAG: hypothetical protein R2789_11515 [Microthrixaceae bacterium]
MSLSVELVSPERVAFCRRCRDGGVVPRRATSPSRPGHIPFIGVLQTHPVKVIGDSGETLIAVHQGFAEVSPPMATMRPTSPCCRMWAELGRPDHVDRARCQGAASRRSLRSDSRTPRPLSAPSEAEA